MRILLLGGSGLLSGAARDTFLAAGHDVTVLSRGARPLPAHARLSTVVGDRRDAASLAAVLGGQRFDFTADFLAFDGDDVTRLLGVAGFAPGRLVMISSGQVYLVTADPRPPFREADADAPLLSEPLAGTRAHDNWAYGMGKRSAEAALVHAGRARGLPTLALRLPVVQGEADGSNSRRLWGWLERMRDGGPVLLPEAGAQRVRFVYAGDAAAALVALAERASWPALPAVNLAQPDECTLREFLESVARLAGVEARFVPVTAEALAQAGIGDECAPWWGRWCSRPDPGHALGELGLVTRTVAAYLPAVVRAHLAHPPEGSHPGYALRERELALALRLGG
jgi:nucleoside-diphosphate-sugar epimerase